MTPLGRLPGEITLLNLMIFYKAVAFSLCVFPIHKPFYSSSCSFYLQVLDLELSEPFEDIAFEVEDKDQLL